MKKKIIKVLSIIGIVVLIGVSFCGCTESTRRELKTINSEWSGGLNRTVTVYTYDGNVIATYTGKIDIEYTEGGKVLFDLNGKRYIYYNCMVEAIEN